MYNAGMLEVMALLFEVMALLFEGFCVPSAVSVCVHMCVACCWSFLPGLGQLETAAADGAASSRLGCVSTGVLF